VVRGFIPKKWLGKIVVVVLKAAAEVIASETTKKR
jgi:hypothetical protein